MLRGPISCSSIKDCMDPFKSHLQSMHIAIGLTAATRGAALGKQIPITLRTLCNASSTAAEAALLAGGPPAPLLALLEVVPTTAPASLVLLRDGVPLQIRDLVGGA